MPLAKPTKPDAITAVPTPVPLRTDRANFAARGDAMMGWFPDGVDEINTTSDYMDDAANFAEQEANEAEASATAAAASNLAAGVNAAAAAASAGATVWVTGTTYAAGVVRYSPTNFQTYRDTVGGVSNTDPASDVSGRWISAMLPSVEAIGLPAMPPTAVFNFASGVIDRRFVESRSTAGTRYNIFGNLETIAAGVAKPTFDPATNEAKGYLSEPAATYLAMRSTELENGAYWGYTNLTITPASALGIDGAMSMFKDEVIATAAAVHYIDATATAAVAYCTVRAKKGSGATDLNKFAVYNLATATLLASLTINYDTGLITQATGSGATAADVGHGGIWEIRIPCTTGITIGNSLRFYLGSNGGPETAGEYAYVGFPDVADKPNLTHIPTAGSNVTTGAGGLTMDLTAHAAIVNPAGFTFVCAFDYPAIDGSTKFICCANDGSGITYIGIDIYNTSVYAQAVIAGVDYGSRAQTSLVGVGERIVVAASFGDGEVRLVQRGGVAVTTALTAALPAFTKLGVGGVPGDAVNYRPGKPIELIAVFPRACTAGELRAFVNNY